MNKLKTSNNFNVTTHKLLTKFYFNSILNKTITFLEKKNLTVLDFGCGNSYLKKKLKNNNQIKVVGYDIIENLSEVKNWKTLKFDYFIAIHVFMYLSYEELIELIDYLKRNKPKIKLIAVISKENFINRIGAFLLNEKEAHTNTRISPKYQIQILKEKMRIIKKDNIFFLSDIYLLSF
jgi:hypothetical protein